MVGVLASAPVGAQVAAVVGETSANDATKIQEVVITSRKRKEKLQDVPLAVSAFSSEMLQDAGVKTLQDLSNLTPGLTISGSGSEAAEAPAIRGMANLSGGASDPNVAVFLDGIYLANSSAVSLGAIDLERIEVVKGPVSALYGRNAFAGALNYVSKRSPKIFGGDASLTFGSGGRKAGTASVGAPLVDGVLGMRLAASYDKYEGTHKDSVNGLRAGGFEKKDVQASFDLTPTDKLSVTGSLYHGEDFFDMPAETYIENNCGIKSTNFVTPGQFSQFCGELVQERPLEVANVPGAGASGNNRNVTSSHLKASYDLGFGDVSALLGYNKVTQQRFADFTGRRDGILFQLATSAGVALPTTVKLPEFFGSDNNNKDKSLELRFASKQNQPLRYAAGLYFFDADSTTSTIIGVDGTAIPAGQTLLSTSARRFITSGGQVNQHYITLVDGTDKIVSEFASADYDLFPGLTLSGEFRHTKEDKSQDILRSTSVADTVRPFGAAQSATFGFNNYRTTASYKASANQLFYASAANGTKAGGFNQRATIASEISYQPELATTYELGSKSTFLDGRLRLNVAVFHIKSKDLQIFGPSDDPTNSGIVTKNFGGTTTNGAEIEVLARPMRGLTLNAGLGYSDPKFIAGTYNYSFGPACLAIPSCAPRVVTIGSAQGPRTVMNLEGLVPLRTSKYQLTFGGQLNTKLTERWNWYGRYDVRYESKQFSSTQNLSWWSPRTVVNLRSGIEDDRYRVTFFVNNVTNDQTPSSVQLQSRLNDGFANPIAYLPEQRSFGVTLGYKF